MEINTPGTLIQEGSAGFLYIIDVEVYIGGVVKRDRFAILE
jgi:hypothetical protein